MEEFLKNLEQVAVLWELLDKAKYRHRIQFFGSFDAAINLIPRRTDNYQTIFALKTLLTSCARPFARTKNGERVSKADKEYFHHSSKLQLRFFEVLNTIKNDLSKHLYQQKPVEPKSIFSALSSWFSQTINEESSIAGSNYYEFDENHPLLKDKVFLRKLKTEIKHFEICLRLFEQTVISTII